jgi:hypothetical protein
VKLLEQEKLSLQEKLIATEATRDGLGERVSILNASVASALSEYTGIREEFNREKSVLDQRISGLEADLLESKKGTQSLSAMQQLFVDPVSNEVFKCPVMQGNGVVRSFGAVIDLWLNESNMGQSNVFRMFQCPVQRNFTMIAPFPIVDHFIRLAVTVGVDVSPPVLFHFKGFDGAWTEFSFHEQLELIVRLCEVYNRRKVPNNPPEQRNVSVGGMSFLITMRSVDAGEGGGFRLECFGINSVGGGKVDIKVTFHQGWTHPFTDMEMPLTTS